MNKGGLLAVGGLMTGLVLAGCGSSSSAPATSAPATSAATSPSTTTASAASSTTATTSSAATSSAATCPTLAQANAALGATYTGPISHSTPGNGVVCEYTGASGEAGVAIFAHQSATVLAGQIAHAPGNPAMPAISGVGDGAFGMTTGGRSIVNAYSKASGTSVAAQGPGSLASVEALARVALSDN